MHPSQSNARRLIDQDDLAWLSSKWEQYKFAVEFVTSKIDDSGMMNVTQAADWLRAGMGGHNIEVCDLDL